MVWGDKPYHSLDYELKRQFGQKIYKVSLDGGMSCPNRDGTVGTGGCTFCSQGGSGEFAVGRTGYPDVWEQIEQAKTRVHRKISGEGKYIAYFQSYTNTYAPVDYLRTLFERAITHPDIVALSVGTRPDCLGDEVVALLKELNRQKPVWVELGLQTIHEKTAERIHRGYRLEVFEDAYRRLKEAGLTVGGPCDPGTPWGDEGRNVRDGGLSWQNPGRWHKTPASAYIERQSDGNGVRKESIFTDGAGGVSRSDPYLCGQTSPVRGDPQTQRGRGKSSADRPCLER